MTRISESVWSRLRNEHVSGEVLWARRASEVTDRLLAALDAEGKRHFLMRLAAGEPELHDLQSRGVSIFTHQLEGRGHEPGQYVDIICIESSGHDAFDLIGAEIAERISTGRESVPECVTRVVAKWRRFWEQASKNILSKQSQIGLFAEVWFLYLWLVPRRGISASVASWRGAFGSRHDFEWESRSVEVKATLASGTPIHRINGLDQLVPPEQGDLLLFSLQLREERGASNNLRSVVAASREILKVDNLALEQFETALVQVGYSSAHEGDYENLHLRIVDERLYEVRDGFPRLTLKDFPVGLPDGVGRLEYDVTLSGLDHLCLARCPTDNFDL
jgi:hypothetical protein